jgi:hypothetical protein
VFRIVRKGIRIGRLGGDIDDFRHAQVEAAANRLFLADRAIEPDADARSIGRRRDPHAGREHEQPHSVRRLEAGHEALQRRHRLACRPGLKTAVVDGKHDGATVGHGRFGEAVGQHRIGAGDVPGVAEELRGDNLPLVAVDRNLERLRAELGDRIAVLVDDLHVDCDDVDSASEAGLLRGGCVRPAGGRQRHREHRADQTNRDGSEPCHRAL